MGVSEQELTFQQTIDSVNDAQKAVIEHMGRLKQAEEIVKAIQENEKGAVGVALRPVAEAIFYVIKGLEELSSLQHNAFVTWTPWRREKRMTERAHAAEHANLCIRQQLELMNGRVLFICQQWDYGSERIAGVQLRSCGPDRVEADGDVFKFKPREEASEE
ncbi:MAG: hypothetical protein ACK5X3_16445 [Pseudomonadota bacterium]|jgi:hypothetical protein